MSTIILSDDQQAAYNGVVQFLASTLPVFVISGYAGTGKSTLVKKLLTDLPNIMRMNGLLVPDTKYEYELLLTATTNKACEALADIAKASVVTIHSLLGLIVNTDYKTGETSLRLRQGAPIVENSIIIIDEASYIDREMLRYIFLRINNCKVIFIGDPAQLLAVGSNSPPVFKSNFPEAKLTEVMRQAKGNPIIDLATQFRHTVNTGEFFSFKPDNVHIRHLPFDKFSSEVINEFNRKDWKYTDSKVLAWRNARVVKYNHAIRDHVQGAPELQPGDYAICNSFIGTANCKLKTDQLVKVTDLMDATQHGVAGKMVYMENRQYAFMPNNIEDKKLAINLATKEGNYGRAREIENKWIDLRAAYSCTVNKSQGSTYDRVFIDLGDIAGCNIANQIARMLYVAVSRARNEVIITGDFV